jgi:hypothetical protein
METDGLIRALGADVGRPRFSLGNVLAAAGLLAIVVAAIVFGAAIGPRPDIAAAAGTMRFLFKFVVTALLAVTAVSALSALSRPQAASRRSIMLLAAAPLALLAAVALELAVMPSARWGTRLVGSNSLYCLSFIPLMGIGPLALFVAALRHGAPSRPALAGAVAGLAAGGIAATLYAAHCTDDSPLFVATWYTLAIAILTGLGAVAGRAFTRW